MKNSQKYFQLEVSILATTLMLAGCAGPFVNSTDSMFPEAFVGGPLDNDDSEKDIVQGDFDGDGDMDFIVARKRYLSLRDGDTGSNTTPNVNKMSAILLVNEAGVLRDRTSTLTTWNTAGQLMTARDVAVADLDNDGDLDAVFANTAREMPRVYRNRGNNAAGAWLGFQDITATVISAAITNVGVLPPLQNPNSLRPLLACAVAIEDIDGDGDKDLYISNYISNIGTADLLLMNRFAQTGNIGFVDETTVRLGDLRYSAFGTAAVIEDFDNDGDMDIAKVSTLYDVHPYPVFGTFVLRNNGTGVFHDGDNNWAEDNIKLSSVDPYMIDVGDYDGDGILDIYEVSDNADWLNFGRLTAGVLSYESVALTRPAVNNLTSGVGGNIKHLTRGEERRLRNPSASPQPDDDVVGLYGLAPIDVQFEVTTCVSPPHRLSLFRNASDFEAWTEALSSDEAILPATSGPGGDPGTPWALLAHDLEFDDIDGDGKVDMLLALCDGYRVLKGVRLRLNRFRIRPGG